MGVPKFAAWLKKKFPSMVLDRCPTDVHGLYIDLNGLIHPCCHDEHDASVALRTEVEKMRSICLAIETLVVTVRPQHVVYIAIDGVAPRAKMNQQRARRYMSAGAPLTNTAKPVRGPADEMSAGVVAAIEKEFTAAERMGAEKDLDDVQEALLGDVLYGGAVGGGETAAAVVAAPAAPPTVFVNTPTAASSEVPNGERFDSNCISPGTAFMDTVAATVRDFVRCKMSAAAAAASAGDVKAGGDDPLTAAATAVAAPLTPPPAASTATSPWANLTVVFSDSATAGEGEHKFIDFLRTQSAYPGFNGGGCHVIAGLDADLIFLSLSLHIPRIVILRDHERSSYEKALLPVAQGGTVTTKQGNSAAAAAVVPHSDSASSIGSAAVVASDVGNFSSTPPPAEMEGEETMATDAISATTGSSPSAVSSPPPPQSPTAATAEPAPPHIATVAADVCTSYEYYDIDVVGSSLVSEIYQLCLEKGMEVKGDPLANPRNCTASNGFVFHHGRQSATAASAKRDASTRSDAAESTASPPPPPPHASPAFHPCTATSNSKIIDDFIVLGMLLGNDFLPHSPSVYCGESAMDTLLDVYVGSVLPHGYLTGGNYEIQLPQMERLFRAYAGVEALLFRQRAIQASTMTPQEAATPEVYSSADRRCWRDTYVRTTSLRDEAGMQAACRAYVEGLRFVWRYYCSISLQVSWSWYFPFHHAPLALDVADFLRAQGPDVQTALAPPKLERLPPTPFCQLLCILPPRSRLLVPSALHPAMLRPPPELAETFPTRWRVDFTGAYGKDHLAAVLLPFANLSMLQEVVAAQAGTYSESEKTRNRLQPTHLVLESRSASTEAEALSASSTTNITTNTTTAAAAAATEKPAATSGKQPHAKSRTRRAVAAAAGPRGFRIQGGGLQPLSATETPAELRGCTVIACSALADTAPPLSRPRTYSHTVAIPNLTVLADGSRVPLDRRPATRYGGGGGGRRRPFYGKGGGGGNRDDRKWDRDREKTHTGGGDGGNGSGEAARPSMLFGEFAVVLAFVAVLTSTVTVRRSTSLLDSLHLLLQLCGIACTVLGLIFALGLAVANKGRSTGSGMHRHSIFTAFVDWQCASCLSRNFSRNRRCFMCRAPYDPHRCVALFSGRNAPEPPLMDPDHEAYAAWYGAKSM